MITLIILRQEPPTEARHWNWSKEAVYILFMVIMAEELNMVIWTMEKAGIM